MTKKLLGLLVIALMCAGIAGASTIQQLCPPVTTATATTGNITPSISPTTLTCAAWSIPVGQTVTAIDLFFANDYQFANGGASTLKCAGIPSNW